MTKRKYRLFGITISGAKKKVKHWLEARDDEHAIEQASAFAEKRTSFALTRLVEIVRKGEYRDVPLSARA